MYGDIPYILRNTSSCALSLSCLHDLILARPIKWISLTVVIGIFCFFQWRKIMTTAIHAMLVLFTLKHVLQVLQQITSEFGSENCLFKHAKFCKNFTPSITSNRQFTTNRNRLKHLFLACQKPISVLWSGLEHQSISWLCNVLIRSEASLLFEWMERNWHPL